MHAHGRTGAERSAYLAATQAGYRGHAYTGCEPEAMRARLQQIRMGKETREYKEYRDMVERGVELELQQWMKSELGASKETRETAFPSTPDPNGSRRSFLSRCRTWRVGLHGVKNWELVVDTWKAQRDVAHGM
jgi:hypothetical protein